MRYFHLLYLCVAALLLSAERFSPPTISAERYVAWAKEEPTAADKISLLRRCLRSFPDDPASLRARDHLIALLSSTNQYKEALLTYQGTLALRRPADEPDLKLLELLLKIGHYAEVSRQTAVTPHNGEDVLFDSHLCELRVQALLAQGRYRQARETVDQWLGMHGHEAMENGRFASDVQSFQQLRRHLYLLERSHGPRAKPLFTASVPDSAIRWSHKRNIPVVFFKLVPADPAHQSVSTSEQTESSFKSLVDDMNRGFGYLSGGAFSLKFGGVHTIYINTQEWEGSGSKIDLLVSRIHSHTIPPLYRLAGKGFGVLVDYRARPDDETAYMGDGLIHITATNLHTLTLMHEVLHGLGATHQEWTFLTKLGYLFNREDLGLMTFDRGELCYLGLEEKNRVLLNWPPVRALPFGDPHIKAATLLSRHIARRD